MEIPKIHHDLKITVFTFDNLNYLKSDERKTLIKDIIEKISSGSLDPPDFLSLHNINKENFQIISKLLKSFNYNYKKVKEYEKEVPYNLLYIKDDSPYMVEDTLSFKFNKTNEENFAAIYRVIKKVDFVPVVSLFPINYPNAELLNTLYKSPLTNKKYITLCITSLEKSLPTYRQLQINEIIKFCENEPNIVISGNMNIPQWQKINTSDLEDSWNVKGGPQYDRFDRILTRNFNVINYEEGCLDLFEDEKITRFSVSTTLN